MPLWPWLLVAVRVSVMRTLELAQVKSAPNNLKEARNTLQEVLDYLRALPGEGLQ